MRVLDFKKLLIEKHCLVLGIKGGVDEAEGELEVVCLLCSNVVLVEYLFMIKLE